MKHLILYIIEISLSSNPLKLKLLTGRILMKCIFFEYEIQVDSTFIFTYNKVEKHLNRISGFVALNGHHNIQLLVNSELPFSLIASSYDQNPMRLLWKFIIAILEKGGSSVKRISPTNSWFCSPYFLRHKCVEFVETINEMHIANFTIYQI